MPFDVGSAYNSAVDWLLNGEVTRRIAKNPIWTAVVIVSMIVFLAWVIVPDIGGFTQAAKLWFVSALGTTVILCLHNHVLLDERESASKKSDYSRMFDRSEKIKTISGIPDVPVIPQVTTTGQGEDSEESSGDAPDDAPDDARDDTPEKVPDGSPNKPPAKSQTNSEEPIISGWRKYLQ